MSGFSTSDNSGVAWPAFFLIFCSPALATRQSATAAAKIATSAGSARSTACSISRAVSTLHDVHAGRIGQIHRPADQRHLGAGARRRRGNGVALLAGRTVGDIAHRIDRLVRRAGGDQHALALERLRAALASNLSTAAAISSGSAMRPMPAFAGFRHLAFVRADQRDAVGDELREIALRRLVRPHVRIHRRRQQDFRCRRQQHRGGEIVGVTAGHLRHQVGGGRRHHDEIGFARETNVADVEFAAGIEQVGEHALAERWRRPTAA